MHEDALKQHDCLCLQGDFRWSLAQFVDYKYHILTCIQHPLKFAGHFIYLPGREVLSTDMMTRVPQNM